jgi:hypothetical protein
MMDSLLDVHVMLVAGVAVAGVPNVACESSTAVGSRGLGQRAINSGMSHGLWNHLVLWPSAEATVVDCHPMLPTTLAPDPKSPENTHHQRSNTPTPPICVPNPELPFLSTVHHKTRFVLTP